MKKSFFYIFVILSFLLVKTNLNSMDGFFVGFRGGLLLKVDIASAFTSKRVIDPQLRWQNSIFSGIGQFGNTNPHGFPRVLEAMVAPYGEMAVIWGYKFPRLFSLGFGVMLSNFVMPYLLFDFKFFFRKDKKVQPYAFVNLYGGVFDGFPFGFTAGGGIDIYLTKHFYLLVETKAGAEIFVSRYYDDGINSNPIWHLDSIYAYGIYGIHIGFGYQFKNPFTDENGKWIGRKKKPLIEKG